MNRIVILAAAAMSLLFTSAAEAQFRPRMPKRPAWFDVCCGGPCCVKPRVPRPHTPHIPPHIPPRR